ILHPLNHDANVLNFSHHRLVLVHRHELARFDSRQKWLQQLDHVTKALKCDARAMDGFHVAGIDSMAQLDYAVERPLHRLAELCCWTRPDGVRDQNGSTPLKSASPGKSNFEMTFARNDSAAQLFEL